MVCATFPFSVSPPGSFRSPRSRECLIFKVSGFPWSRPLQRVAWTIRHLRITTFVAVYEAVKGGLIEEGRALFHVLYPLVQALFSEPDPAPVKCALAGSGWIRDEIRLPLTGVTGPLRDRLHVLLAEHHGTGQAGNGVRYFHSRPRQAESASSTRSASETRRAMYIVWISRRSRAPRHSRFAACLPRRVWPLDRHAGDTPMLDRMTARSRDSLNEPSTPVVVVTLDYFRPLACFDVVATEVPMVPACVAAAVTGSRDRLTERTGRARPDRSGALR